MGEQVNWEYMHTEEYIRKKEREEQEWNQKNGKQQEEYLAYIEQKLKERTKEAREELLALFQDKSFIETYKAENDFAYMIVIMQIYENERNAGEEKTILDMGRESAQIIAKLQELKFTLWRMEFAKEAAAPKYLAEFVKMNQATPEMLKYMVHTSVCDKAGILMQMADVFIEQNMFRYAFQMLEYDEELLPGNEEILCVLAQLCMCAGKEERASEYLRRIKNPGKLAEGIREKYGC